MALSSFLVFPSSWQSSTRDEYKLCFKNETSSKVPEALPASSVNQVAETLEQVNIIGTSVVGAWYFLLCMRHLVKEGGFRHHHPDHHHQPPCQRGSGLLQRGHGHSTLTECRVTRSCNSKFKFIRFLFWEWTKGVDYFRARKKHGWRLKELHFSRIVF